MAFRKVTSLDIEANSLLELFKKYKPTASNLGNLKVDNDPIIPRPGKFGPAIILYTGAKKDQSAFVNISKKLLDDFNGEVTLQQILHDFPVYNNVVFENETVLKGDKLETVYDNSGRPKRKLDANGKWIPRKRQDDGSVITNWTLGKKGIMNITDLDLADVSAPKKKVVATDDDDTAEVDES